MPGLVFLTFGCSAKSVTQPPCSLRQVYVAEQTLELVYESRGNSVVVSWLIYNLVAYILAGNKGKNREKLDGTSSKYRSF